MADDLPQELLGEIFVLCLLESDSVQPNPQVPPLLFCHVCPSWRRAAFGTPQLWRELSMVFKFASFGPYLNRGFLGKQLEVLKLWNTCRGGLLPSLRFHYERPRSFVSDESNFVPIRTLFRCPAVSNAEALTLSSFALQDFHGMSAILKDIDFSNLQFLSITQPVGQEYNTRTLQFPACPSLQRLHFDSYAELSSNPSRIVTAFVWTTLTHFSARLELRRRDWYLILEQCVNLSSGIFTLIWPRLDLPITNRGIFHHPNLKTLSVRGDPSHLQLAVDGFIFPSLIALRIYCTPSPDSLGTVHSLLNATPSLKELHLQSCIPFDTPNPLRQPHISQLTGSLSKFVPHLRTLVIDPGKRVLSDTLVPFLHSSWLNDGWSFSSTQKSVEFILYGGQDLNISLRNKIDPSVSLNFRLSGHHIPGPLWKPKKPTAAYLRDHWDDLFAFFYRG